MVSGGSTFSETLCGGVLILCEFCHHCFSWHYRSAGQMRQFKRVLYQNELTFNQCLKGLYWVIFTACYKVTPIITLSKVQAAFCRRVEGQTFFFFFFFGIFLITHGTKEDIQHYLFLGYKVYQLKQQTEKKHNYLTNLSYICMCIT